METNIHHHWLTTVFPEINISYIQTAGRNSFAILLFPSCESNVTKCFSGSRLVLVASRDIMEREEVSRKNKTRLADVAAFYCRFLTQQRL